MSFDDVEITVVDAMMGQGKTSAAINYMEDNCDSERYLYITPYLEESDRIKESCPKCNFKTPETHGTKLRGIKELLRKGHNITSTHALFGRLDDDALKLVRCGGYILIMDEVYDVVTTYPIKKADLNLIVDTGLIKCDEYGFLKWCETKENRYTGDYFNKLKGEIESHTLIAGGVMEDGTPDARQPLFRVVPIKSFSSFKRVLVLTYMFDGSIQKAYFDYFGFRYKIIGVSKTNGVYGFSNTHTGNPNIDLKPLITIWTGGRQSSLGEKNRALSYNWYAKRGRNDPEIIKLKRNTTNFYINVARTKSSENLWTTFRSAKAALSGPGYTKGFEAHNARATNKHKNRTAVAYLVNKFINPRISRFFSLKGVTLDEDKYALGSMVQFIWRSAIRDGKPIILYIPSQRMRSLFENWIEEVSANATDKTTETA